MATQKIDLPKDTWVLVANGRVLFQMADQTTAYAIQSADMPVNSDTSIKQRIIPGKIYSFRKYDGDLYMYSPGKNSSVIIDTSQGIAEAPIELDSILSDQISDPLEFYLSRKINETSLTADIPINTAGDPWEVTETTQVTLADSTGLAVELWIEIWEGPFKYQSEIIAVNGAIIDLSAPIGFPFTTSAVVYVVDIDQNKDFTGAGIGPQIYSYDPPPIYTEDTHENRFLITMLHAAESDASTYGDIQGGLDEGIVFSGRGKLLTRETGLASDLVVYNSLFVAKTNEDYKGAAYDVTFEPKSGNPASPTLYGTSIRKTFNGFEKSGVVIPVRRERDEATRALFRDDLSGLSLHRIKVHGHQVIY